MKRWKCSPNICLCLYNHWHTGIYIYIFIYYYILLLIKIVHGRARTLQGAAKNVRQLIYLNLSIAEAIFEKFKRGTSRFTSPHQKSAFESYIRYVLSTICHSAY